MKSYWRPSFSPSYNNENHPRQYRIEPLIPKHVFFIIKIKTLKITPNYALDVLGYALDASRYSLDTSYYALYVPHHPLDMP